MQAQWLVLAFFLLALVVDHRVLWRAFMRRVALDPAGARRTIWVQWALMLWTCSALVLWLWLSGRLPMASPAFAMPAGWRLWAPVVAVAGVMALQVGAGIRIARLDGDKARLREQLGSTARMMPREARELPAWLGLSLTAGFCEELLFRGFVVWTLQPLVGAWPAAVASVALFSVAHAYQGREGLARTAMMGAAFAAIVALAGSLWPAIVFHAALDAVGGWIGWLILRDDAARPGEDALSPG